MSNGDDPMLSLEMERMRLAPWLDLGSGQRTDGHSIFLSCCMKPPGHEPGTGEGATKRDPVLQRDSHPAGARLCSGRTTVGTLVYLYTFWLLLEIFRFRRFCK